MRTNPFSGFWSKYNLAIKRIVLILTKWIFFNVGIALIPLLFTYTILGNGQDSFKGFLNHFALKGELLVLSTALIGEGISELLATSIVARFIRITLGGICTLALILACFLYANISTLSSTTQNHSPPSISDSATANSVEKDRNDKISGLSQQLFLLSLLAGASCKVIAAIEPESSTSQNIKIQPSGGGQTGGTIS